VYCLFDLGEDQVHMPIVCLVIPSVRIQHHLCACVERTYVQDAAEFTVSTQFDPDAFGERQPDQVHLWT
jgi:hypothetical protein